MPSGHPERGLVEIEDGFLFLPLCLVLLAQAHDRAHRLGVEAVALHLGIDFLDVVGDRLLLFFKALDALDEGPQLAGCHGLGGLAGNVFGQGGFSCSTATRSAAIAASMPEQPARVKRENAAVWTSGINGWPPHIGPLSPIGSAVDGR